MNKKLVLLGAGLLLGAAAASAQQRVKGRVVDTAGQPVIGASVRVEGTKSVTITDENGYFTLTNVPATAKKLRVSYIGKEAQVVSIAGNVKVVLADNENMLEQAVVVGYGTAKKLGTVVGSVKQVSGEVIESSPSANIADALQGQVAGMSVANMTGDVGEVNNMHIQLRGAGSISASTTPLIVVDGSPAGTAILSMLSSNDIENITTLKDASATSIYGSRAANGVIYITTKKGRKNEKAVVTLSQRIGWSSLARRIGNPASADELLDFQLENGIIYADNYVRFKQHGADTDWQDYNFNSGVPMYNTDLSIRGGSENTNYFISASYLKQNGLTDFSDFKRTTLRTNIDTKVNSWLSVGVNQSIAYTERQQDGYTQNGTANVRSASSSSVMYAPYWDPYDESVKTTHEVWGSGTYDNKWLLSVQPSDANDVVYNGSAYVQINPLRGLVIRSQLGLYATETRSSLRVLPSAAELLSMTADARESFNRSSMWTITNTAEYKFNIGQDHAVTLLAGQEGIKSDVSSFQANASGLQDDRLLTLSNAVTAELPSDSKSKYEYLSFFGRVDYGYKDKYFANFTVRSDASSRFGSDNRTALFYSGGLMWEVMREKFMEDVSWLISNLQVKASVGSTGNSEIGNYAHLGITGNTTYNSQMAWYFAQYAAPDLGWEKQIQANIGFSIAFMDKLSLDFNFYNRKTKNMLMSVPLAYTSGLSSQMRNVGEMSNRGVELELSYDIVRTKDWYVNVRANYSYNKNVVDKLFYDLSEWPMKSYMLNYIVGQSLNYYLPIYAGVDKEDGAPMWYKKGHKGDPVHTYNPETMTKDASQIEDLYQDTGKSQNPPHFGGFGFTVSWKGLSLSADFSYVLGKYMVNNTYFWSTSSSNAVSGFNIDRDYLSLWKKPGDIASLPGFEYDSQFDTHLLENSSYLRLKNLTLSYDLPKEWLRPTKFISGVRVSFTGRNLLTVTKYKGADPEIQTNLTAGNYPATRDYTLGVEVSF